MAYVSIFGQKWSLFFSYFPWETSLCISFFLFLLNESQIGTKPMIRLSIVDVILPVVV